MNLNDHKALLRLQKWLAGVHLAHEVQVAGEPQWELESQNARTFVVTLSAAQVGAEPARGRRLLENICRLEDAQLLYTT